MTDNLTHKGWFYIVPIWCSEDAEYMEMRWTGWDWPIAAMCHVHGFFNMIFQNDMGFPIVITGVRK